MLNNNDIKLILKSLDKSINAMKKKGKKHEDLINDYIEIKNKLTKNIIEEVAKWKLSLMAKNKKNLKNT